jgi:hypothetical protein
MHNLRGKTRKAKFKAGNQQTALSLNTSPQSRRDAQRNAGKAKAKSDRRHWKQRINFSDFCFCSSCVPLRISAALR